MRGSRGRVAALLGLWLLTLNSCFQVPRGFEADRFASLNLDCLAGTWVYAVAGFGLPDRERTEVQQSKTTVFLISSTMAPTRSAAARPAAI